MMAGFNSIIGYAPDKLEALQEAAGITKFSGTNGEKWAQIINGIQIQGGLLEEAGEVEFHAPYETQLLGVFVNGGTVTDASLTGFTSSVSGYWWAIGV
jgi:hypothetical protein